MRAPALLAAVVALSASSSLALSGAFDNIHGLEDAKRMLYQREDNPSATIPATQSSASPAPTNNKDDNNKSALSSASASGAGSRATTEKPSATGNSTAYDPRLPAGGISMVTPNPMLANYYKVGDWVTFAWNYTSLSATPSAIDIMVSCTANQATYTIAVNQSAQQTQVLWDTSNKPPGQAPFVTDNYMLLIYDAESSVSATPRAGYLATFSQFTFGMYTPQPYVAWKDFTCPNCNSAASHLARMTITALLMTTGTTLASLLYFSYTFGVW